MPLSIGQPFDPSVGQLVEAPGSLVRVGGSGGEGQRRLPSLGEFFQECPPLVQRQIPGVMSGHGQDVKGA
jgi:hypothetical protein